MNNHQLRQRRQATNSSTSKQKPSISQLSSVSQKNVHVWNYKTLLFIAFFTSVLVTFLAPYLQQRLFITTHSPKSSISSSSSLESKSKSFVLSNVRSVEVIETDSPTPVLDYLRRSQQDSPNAPLLPVVFRHTSVDDWTALERWNPSAFAQGRLIPSVVLTQVYIHNVPIFGPYWDATRPFRRIPTIERPNPHREVNLTVQEFFHRITHPQPNTYLYYSGSIETVSALIDDLQPFDVMLELDTSTRQKYPDLQRGQNINVWFGQKGVIAAVHYDAYDNLYAQIYGTKRWYLVSPSHARQMYLYPFLHPSHAQSQLIDIRHVNESRFPLFVKTPPPLYVVTLQPGDVLFLPACWFHFVEALNVSLSVNVWTRTPQSALMTKISQELPFRPQETRVKKLHTAVHYIVLLLRELNFSSPRSELYDLYTERYEPLVLDGQLIVSKDFLPTSCPTFSLSNVALSVHNLAKQHATQLRTLPTDTFRIWLHNHIEAILFYALEVSDGRLVPSFLYYCFDSVP